MRDTPKIQSDILQYIVDKGFMPGDQLPTIQDISEELGVSVAKTRESLEVARALGIVEIKPGRGTRVAEYSFEPAVRLSVLYSIGMGTTRHFFKYVRQMRNAIEVSFWAEATRKLEKKDIDDLQQVVDDAFAKLEKSPIQVPALEHRAFHLGMFSRLGNPFTEGFLKAYWEAHDAFGLNMYAEIDYHKRVWDYHDRILDTIRQGDTETGRKLLIEHFNLVRHQEDLERTGHPEVPTDLEMIYSQLLTYSNETSPQPVD